MAEGTAPAPVRGAGGGPVVGACVPAVVVVVAVGADPPAAAGAVVVVDPPPGGPTVVAHTALGAKAGGFPAPKLQAFTLPGEGWKLMAPNWL